MQVVQHNLASMFTQRELKITTGNKQKNTEKLSSGYRVNRGADDAAGLAISEKMRWQIRGLGRAADNIQDGISFIQTGEGALNEIHSMLGRIRELAVQSSNDTNTESDRENIDKEVQQIKKEMNRVYNTTQFNTLYIFRAPYVPSIDDGELKDYELYDTGMGSPASGIMINNKRYTWGELGLTSTTATDDWEKKFTDDNGELIWLTLNKGDDVTQMERHYLVEADDTGILINKLYAGKWDGGTPPITRDGDTYKLQFHGVDLSFEVESDEDRDTIIQRINGDGLFVNGWRAIPAGGSGTSAVSSSADNIQFNVTNTNKNSIANWAYQITADDTGVTLKQTAGNDGITHTKTPWASFTNTSGGQSFPISDWGTTDEGSNPVTLDSSAVYKYTDSGSAGYYTNNMQFTFQFTVDEVSKEQAKIGLTQNLTGGAVNAPIRSVTADAGVNVNNARGFDNFTFQRDKLNRDFGTTGASTAMTFTVDRAKISDGSVTDHEYRLKLSQAYGKLNTTTTTSTITRYAANPSEVFLDADGNTFTPAEGTYSYDQTIPGDEESTPSTSGPVASYVTNTGLDPAYTHHTEDTSSFSPSGTKTIERVLTYQDGTETKTGKVQLTYQLSQATHTKTDASYETSGGGLVNYVSDGAGGYNQVSSSDYYVVGSGDKTEWDGTAYHSLTPADGSAQRYVQTGDGWKDTVTYNLYHYSYAAKKESEIILNGSQSGTFLDTNGGAATSKTITDANGIAHAYYTDAQYRNVTLSSGAGQTLNLIFSGGSDARTSTVTVTPNGPATRTFTKGAQTGGGATDTALVLKVNAPDKLLHIQAGALGGQSIDLEWPSLSNSIVGISSAKVTSFGTSQAAIRMADEAISYISDVRSRFGAYQNRLEHAYDIDRNTEENTQAAESRIRDTDMAKEMVSYSKNEILAQAGQAMLVQANQQPMGILTLLNG